MRDGARVTLEGYIVKQKANRAISCAVATMKPLTGDPEKVFDGKTYDAEDQVRMNGRLRHDGARRWVDVEQLGAP